MSKPPAQLLKPEAEPNKFEAAEDFSLESQTEEQAQQAGTQPEKKTRTRRARQTEGEQTATKAPRSPKKAPQASRVAEGSTKTEKALKPQFMRLNADVPIELYKKVKMASWDRGITVKELLIELLEQHL